MTNCKVLFAATIIAATAFATPSAATSVQVAQTESAEQPRQAPKPVTKADFTKNLDSRFAALDANKDGALSKDEIAAAQTRALQQAAEQQKQLIEAQFRKLDTDKNNQLSLAEFMAVAQPVRSGASADQMLSQLDSNNDGRVTVQEFRAPQLSNFDKADANSDGMITPEEAQAARNRR